MNLLTTSRVSLQKNGIRYGMARRWPQSPAKIYVGLDLLCSPPLSVPQPWATSPSNPHQLPSAALAQWDQEGASGKGIL